MSAIAAIKPRSLICLSAPYTLTSSTALQKMFGVGNGALTLGTGLYSFFWIFSVSAMSATTGNARMDVLGAGTATLLDTLNQGVGLDNAPATNGTWTGQMQVTKNTLVSMCSGAINTDLQGTLEGFFRISVAGTIIPSIQLVTAAAAIVATDSAFACNYECPVATQTVGQWS